MALVSSSPNCHHSYGSKPNYIPPLVAQELFFTLTFIPSYCYKPWHTHTHPPLPSHINPEAKEKLILPRYKDFMLRLLDSFFFSTLSSSISSNNQMQIGPQSALKIQVKTKILTFLLHLIPTMYMKLQNEATRCSQSDHKSERKTAHLDHSCFLALALYT